MRMAWLWWAVGALILAWVVLKVAAVAAGGLIHLLLVIALILLIYNLAAGRRAFG